MRLPPDAEPDPQIDRLWAKEAGERHAAYRRGEINYRGRMNGKALELR
jgi:hypothetical protein